MFTGRTKNLGILGWPVEHSLSPAMQNAALQKAGLDYVYVALPVQPKHLGDAVAGLRHMGFAGWNVTIPHKSEILPLLDDVHEDARVIGAVNTVV
ncbi:MAG: shikimate dehydrogenase, partial [Selenomonadaceae bacterium]|nr:shikimate dehydrogenase [Selenomonadaceae bacterium]